MLTARSTSACELLSPSAAQPALHLRLRQWKALKDKTNQEGEWTSTCSTKSTTSPSEGKMERKLSKPWGHHQKADTGSSYYSGPPTDLADTVSLPKHPRGSAWRPELPTTIRSPEVCPAYVEDSHHPGPTYGALERTAELLARLLFGSEDPDVTALSEAVKAKLDITEPLPKPVLAHPHPD